MTTPQIVGTIGLDHSTAMAFLIEVNAEVIRRRVGTRGLLLTPADKTAARKALVDGKSAAEFVDWLVQRDASFCVCGDTYRQHGALTGACLAKHGGRFDGATDQVRCRCRKFTMKVVR
jgi:hypothetical protein